MKPKNPKLTLLDDHRAKKQQNDANARNSITLSKQERREIGGFKARQREVDQMAAPLNADVREFLAEVQERYSVTIGVTHTLDFENCTLEPMPEATAVCAEPAPEPSA